MIDLDPFAPDVVEDPRPFFAALREHAPVYRLPNGAYTLITRDEDVRTASLDPETFSSNLVAVLMADQIGGDTPEILDLTGAAGPRAVDVLAIADAPAHTRQRKLTNKAFSPARVTALEPRIREVAEQCVQPLIAAGAGDWVRDVAVPLPLIIICELLGLPTDNLTHLKVLSDASVSLLSGVNTPEQFAQHAGHIDELLTFLAEQFDKAAAAPAENVLGDLARAVGDQDTDLSRDEAVSILVQLLTAGNETTTSLIGSAVMLMLRDAQLEEQLRADSSLLNPFIEEVLRLEAPFYGHFRVVRRDTEVAGVPLKVGDRLMLSWGAANRDESAYPNANQVDLSRPRPSGHLGFGVGIHHCIGAALARMETRVALQSLLDASSNLRLAADNDFQHAPSLFVRSLRALRIEATAR
jgi:cytochrome P450